MLIWLYFAGSCVAYGLAVYAAWRIGVGKSNRATTVAGIAACALIAIYLAWRLRPDIAVRLCWVELLAFFETTGFVPPATFVFVLASRRLKPRRAAYGLVFLSGALGTYMLVRWAATLVGVQAQPAAVFDADGVSRQTTSETCGAAALVGLLNYFGIASTEEEMARLALTDVFSGTSELRMFRALQQKLAGANLKPRFAKMTWDEILSAPKPCVIVVVLRTEVYADHVVLLKEAMREGVMLDDPGKGRVGWTKALFLKDWTGYAIWLERR